MPEMTDADLARIRHAVQLRERCIRAAVADGQRLDIPMSEVQAAVVYDAMVDLIRADERAGAGERGPAGVEET